MPDPERFLITRPRHETRVFYLHQWSTRLIQDAEEEGLTVHDLEEEEAKRDKFESYMGGVEPRLIVLNGHGDAERVGGHEDEPILVKDENDDTTTDKLFYVRTCRSAAELGRSCVENHDADAFIGYEGEFTLVWNGNRSANPLQDRVAQPIMEASNAAPRALIKGKTVEEAYEAGQEAYQDAMEKVLADYDLGNRDVFTALASNRERQVVLGTPSSSLS